MSLQVIALLGNMLVRLLTLFSDCFHGSKGRRLLAVYVRGLPSDIERKNVEAIALKQQVAPRTLQRFLESIKWDHQEVLRRCRRLIAHEHVDPGTIGVIDETHTHGGREASIQGQSRRSRKSCRDCRGLLRDQQLPTPHGRSHVLDPGMGRGPLAPKKTHVPDDVKFATKSDIALQLIDEAMTDGVRVKAWTFDGNYGRDGHFLDGYFLDGLDQRRLAFVGEVHLPFTFG